MANFSASDVKSGTAVDANKIITYLETLPCQLTSATGGSTSSASTTLVSLVSASVTVSSDDLIGIFTRVAFSSSDGSATSLRVELQDGSGALISDEVDYGNAASSTDGDRMAKAYFHFLQTQTGSKTYTMKFSRNTGSGTIYSARSAMYVLVFKKRA